MIKMSSQQDLSSDRTNTNTGFQINPLDVIKYLLSRGVLVWLSLGIFVGLCLLSLRQHAQHVLQQRLGDVQGSVPECVARARPFQRYGVSTNVSNEILQLQAFS
jgi:hypothetical protein